MSLGLCGICKVVSPEGNISFLFDWNLPSTTFYCKWKIYIPKQQHTIFKLKYSPFQDGVSCSDAYMLLKTEHDRIKICPSNALDWKYITNDTEVVLKARLHKKYWKNGFQMNFIPYESRKLFLCFFS